MNDTPHAGDLSFDRAIPVAAAGDAGGVTCASCRRTIPDAYHTANGEPVCGACRTGLEAAARGVRESGLLARATALGVGAMVAGAFVYWAVMRFAQLEIGLVAILNGWMVGKAMRKGADGRGGRALQVVAALLVYGSVALAYLPFALQRSLADYAGLGGAIALAAFTVALPVFAIIGSLPGGLLSALIIGFGMLQAWQLTGTPRIAFQGPFRVGGPGAP